MVLKLIGHIILLTLIRGQNVGVRKRHHMDSATIEVNDPVGDEGVEAFIGKGRLKGEKGVILGKERLRGEKDDIEENFGKYSEEEKKRKYNLEDSEAPNYLEEEKMRGEIASSAEDVLDLEEICDTFYYEYGFDICEFEGGWKKRNNRGRYFGSDSGRLLVDKKQKKLDLAPKIKKYQRRAFRKIDLDKKRHLATCSVQNNLYHEYEYRGDLFFEKSVRFLVADPKFKANDLEDANDALIHLKYCTEDKFDLELETHFIPVDVSGKNWMAATYEVMNKATEMGIEFNTTEMNDGNDKKYKFNTANHLTMIILPDDVDFDGAYGFAALHYGLSVLKSNAAKEEENILHEIGHNLGMKHSSSPSDGEYGDDRCIMGDSKGKRGCFNGPKSYYLGLYMDYTAVITGEMSCNVVVSLADVDDHLSNRNRAKNVNGEYYVLLAVKVPVNETVEPIYMMYHKDSNIVAVTTGAIGEMKNIDGDRLLFSDVSQRLIDLKRNDSIVLSGVLLKRCPSSSVAKVLVSFDPDAPNEC